MNDQRILYLTWHDLESLQLDFEELFAVLTEAFAFNARGEVTMPPMTFFQRLPKQWFHLTMSWIPAMRYAAAKFQSGDFTGPDRPRPSVQGLIVLCDDVTGDMVAIMDARWITGMRTAAASALMARAQAKAASRRLAILGCGLQGRLHLPAIKAAVPTLTSCRVYDIAPRAMASYIADLDGKYGVQVTASRNVEDLVREADIVVTAGAITGRERQPEIVPAWLAPGSLTIAIDFDSYITDEAIAAADLVVTDDRAQFESKQRELGIFSGVKRIDADLGDILLSGAGRRANETQRVVAFMLGLAIEDLAAAVEVYARARSKGIGTWLPV